MPITPAIAKLPVMMYAIKNVADDPVTRQVIVLIKLLLLVSLKTKTLSYFSSTN
jgi:hypothetical protein